MLLSSPVAHQNDGTRGAESADREMALKHASKAHTPPIARLLREYARRNAPRGGNPCRSKAYSQAADSLMALAVPRLIAEGRLTEIPGVGDAISDIIIVKLQRTGRRPGVESFGRKFLIPIIHDKSKADTNLRTASVPPRSTWVERPKSSAVIARGLRKEHQMTKTIAVAIALLLGSSSFALAQNGSGMTSPGAAGSSPGHEMQNSKTKTGPGASEYSPGDRMHDKGTVGQSKGASEYSPGDRMNDKRK
jgi:hypothetical protein